MKVPAAIRLAWAQITLAIVVGIALSFVSTEGWYAPLHHVGIGLIVAAAVTTFWQFREFLEHFEKFAQAVLVHDEHLKKLNTRALQQLRSRADAAILRSCVDNPNFKRQELTDWIDELLYTKLLPGKAPGAGIYRDRFEEEICLEYPTLEEALLELKCSVAGIPTTELTHRILRITSTSSYKVVAPRRSDGGYAVYAVPYSGKGADLPHFPLEHRLHLRVGHNEADAVPLNIAITDDPLGGITYQAAKHELPIVNAECDVWLRVVEYRSPERESHVLNVMGTLTRSLSVHLYVSGPSPNIVFDGDMIATGVSEGPHHSPHSVRLRHNGWLFEDHGYYIWWWTK